MGRNLDEKHASCFLTQELEGLIQHTLNFGSEMVWAKHVSGKNMFCSMNVDKIRGKEVLESYIVI